MRVIFYFCKYQCYHLRIYFFGRRCSNFWYRYGLQHVPYTLLDVFQNPVMTSFEDILQFRKKSQELNQVNTRAGEPQERVLKSNILIEHSFVCNVWMIFLSLSKRSIHKTWLAVCSGRTNYLLIFLLRNQLQFDLRFARNRLTLPLGLKSVFKRPPLMIGNSIKKMRTLVFRLSFCLVALVDATKYLPLGITLEITKGFDRL